MNDPTGSEVKSSEVDVTAGPEMRSPRADFLAVNDPVVGDLDSGDPGADK